MRIGICVSWHGGKLRWREELRLRHRIMVMSRSVNTLLSGQVVANNARNITGDAACTVRVSVTVPVARDDNEE
jgi:hypothetical protein